ncbi:hypothetical protein ACO7_180032 [Thiomonas arsenitoxydans]|nr:hypothetical protein ACO3_200014 [Thiomonas arsenitoxydans]CQR29449.1 hypothetical protein ACO7_180032 [Thiomonas arsenitoxydans]
MRDCERARDLSHPMVDQRDEDIRGRIEDVVVVINADEFVQSSSRQKNACHEVTILRRGGSGGRCQRAVEGRIGLGSTLSHRSNERTQHSIPMAIGQQVMACAVPEVDQSHVGIVLVQVNPCFVQRRLDQLVHEMRDHVVALVGHVELDRLDRQRRRRKKLQERGLAARRALQLGIFRLSLALAEQGRDQLSADVSLQVRRRQREQGLVGVEEVETCVAALIAEDVHRRTEIGVSRAVGAGPVRGKSSWARGRPNCPTGRASRRRHSSVL